MENRVEEYIKKQSPKYKEIIEKLRKIISKNFPKIKETAMAEGLWYEGKFYIASFRDHVNLGVGINGLSKKEADLFDGKGKTMRHLKFYSIEDIKEKELINLIKITYKKSKCDCKINWKK
jgi:hypothetical protein